MSRSTGPRARRRGTCCRSRTAAATTSAMASLPLIAATSAGSSRCAVMPGIQVADGWTAARWSRRATAAPARCSAGTWRSGRRRARRASPAAGGGCRAGRRRGAARRRSCRCPGRPARRGRPASADRMIVVLLGLDGLDDVAPSGRCGWRSARPAAPPRRSAPRAGSGSAAARSRTSSSRPMTFLAAGLDVPPQPRRSPGERRWPGRTAARRRRRQSISSCS